MSTATPDRRTTPPLVEGQRLDRPTFHARYEAMPPGTRAELIEGVVSMPSPLGFDHSTPVIRILGWLDYFEEHTEGVQALENATVFLSDRSEPQPDALLRVLPGSGGRTKDTGTYVDGAPELVVEVSRSTKYVDLGPKLNMYERAGVLEYIVRTVEPDEVIWHVLENGRFEVVRPDPDGLYRSRTFPGLWLDPVALLAGNRAAVRRTIDLGFATAGYAAFVARLAEARANS